MSRNKDNVEIVNWHFLRNEALETLKRQATREDGQLLILSPDNGLAADLSTLPSNLSSANKDNTKSSEKQISKEEIIQKEDNVGKKLVEDRKNYLTHRRDLEDFVSYRNPIAEEAGIYQDPSGWAVVKNGRFSLFHFSPNRNHK